MYGAQSQVTANFVVELLDLEVFWTLAEGRYILIVALLFVVPKEGQACEWQVIADILVSGQNECIEEDPMFSP